MKTNDFVIHHIPTNYFFQSLRVKKEIAAQGHEALMYFPVNPREVEAGAKVEPYEYPLFEVFYHDDFRSYHWMDAQMVNELNAMATHIPATEIGEVLEFGVTLAAYTSWNDRQHEARKVDFKEKLKELFHRHDFPRNIKFS